MDIITYRYIIPHKLNGVDAYLDKAVDICKKWGVSCLDLRPSAGMIGLIPLYKQIIPTEVMVFI